MGSRTRDLPACSIARQPLLYRVMYAVSNMRVISYRAPLALVFVTEGTINRGGLESRIRTYDVLTC
jgi:hypothetical protein